MLLQVYQNYLRIASVEMSVRNTHKGSGTMSVSSNGYRTSQVAKTVEQDILSGDYRRGDRYLSVRQLAERYSVSPNTAQRVIRTLADRRILAVHPRVGTFVGPAVQGQRALTDIIQFVIVAGAGSRQRFFNEGLQEGMFEALPGMRIQLNALPAANQEEFVESLLDGNGGESYGSVLMRVPRWIREYHYRRKRLAVNIGHVENDIELAYVDRDQSDIGKQVGEYFLHKGYRNIMLLMEDAWYPGDNLLSSTLERELALNSDAAVRFRVQSLRREPNSAAFSIKHLLEQADRPAAIICRSTFLATTVLQVANEEHLQVPRELAIMSVGTDDSRLQRVRPQISSVTYDGWEMGRQVGLLLKKLHEGVPPRELHVELPVEIVERQSS